MPRPATDSPAALYGPVSLVFGVAALVGAVLGGYAAITVPLLGGALAVTFGALGLADGVRRAQCAAGLATGGLGLLYAVLLVAALSG